VTHVIGMFDFFQSIGGVTRGIRNATIARDGTAIQIRGYSDGI